MLFPYVYPSLIVFTYVYTCLPMFSRLLMFTYIYHCFLVFMFTTVYSYMLTHVYPCLLVITYAHTCSPLFTRVYLCLLVFSNVYTCSPIFATVYLCLPLFTHIQLCLLVSTKRGLMASIPTVFEPSRVDRIRNASSSSLEMEEIWSWLVEVKVWLEKHKELRVKTE